MTEAPISYAAARDVITRWAFHISRQGPDPYEMTRQKYADDLKLLRASGELVGMHADRLAAKGREARG